MAYSEDPAILVTGSYDHTLRFWDAFKEESVKHIEYGSDHIVNRIEVSPDKAYLGAACTYNIKLYDPSKQSDVIVYDGFSNNVTTIGFQKDCKWIYASSEDGSIRICDLRTTGFQRTYANKEAMNCVVLHPNEGDLIAGDQQGNIKIFDLAADKMRAKISPAPDIGLRSVSIALNGFYLVGADSAGYCHVWTLRNGDELVPFQKFAAHEDYILKCLVSPDVQFLATCSADKTVKIWSLNEEKGYELHKTLYGHHKWVWDCAFSCDSQLLVTCSTDCVAKIWSLENGEVIRNFTGHTRGINCVALNDRSQ